jgi:hypothetical protein
MSSTPFPRHWPCPAACCGGFQTPCSCPRKGHTTRAASDLPSITTALSPSHPSPCCPGAVLFAADPGAVAARRVRRSYGLSTMAPWSAAHAASAAAHGYPEQASGPRGCDAPAAVAAVLQRRLSLRWARLCWFAGLPSQPGTRPGADPSHPPSAPVTRARPTRSHPRTRTRGQPYTPLHALHPHVPPRPHTVARPSPSATPPGVAPRGRRRLGGRRVCGLCSARAAGAAQRGGAALRGAAVQVWIGCGAVQVWRGCGASLALPGPRPPLPFVLALTAISPSLSPLPLP